MRVGQSRCRLVHPLIGMRYARLYPAGVDQETLKQCVSGSDR